MAQFVATTTANGSGDTARVVGAGAGSGTGAGAGAAVRGGGSGEPSRQEVQRILGQFDAKINQMMDYPAKDIINSLTMAAERVEYAPEIVSFLETKIHRAPANYKLPIFYLTDSILKNVRGPYASLLGRNIVPLYCNCVKQVSGKDLRRFIHVLNTWDSTRLFPADALAQMRQAANRAVSAAEPSSVAQQPVSFSQEPPPPSARRAGAVPPPPAQATDHKQKQQQKQQEDMELRKLLMEMQNDMGIHPTEHLTLEQVRVQNPAWYAELVDFNNAAKCTGDAATMSSATTPAPAAPGGGILATPPISRFAPHTPGLVGTRAGQGGLANGVAGGRGVRRNGSRFSPVPPQQMHPSQPHPVAHPQRMGPPPPQQVDPTKTGNVAHLMELLKRKKAAPSPSLVPPMPPPPAIIAGGPPRGAAPPPPPPPHMRRQEVITNEMPPGTAPSAAHVMSILRKLQGLNGAGGDASTKISTSQETASRSTNDSSASKMWFSDKIVAHKDRVESNIQKLYAALPLVCRESGLRFKAQDKLNAHLDFLFQFNRSQRERGKGGVSRSWYPDEEQWVTDFSGDSAPRETTSSSFFDRKESDDEKQDDYGKARVPVDETITRCRICGDKFEKSWDEEEEDWMYTNAVFGTIHQPESDTPEIKTIFHKYCYDTVMTNSKQITPEHLIPGTPQGTTSTSGPFPGGSEGSSDLKRTLEKNESDSDDDDDDIKRVRTE